MKKLIFLFVYLPCSVFAQEASPKEASSVSQTFLIKNINTKKNEMALIDLQSYLKNLTTNSNSKNNIEFSLKRLDLKSNTKELLKLGDVVDPGDIVDVKDAVAKLFDPEHQPCDLPEKVLKKLKKYKEDKNMWAPKYVVQQLNQMPDKALLFKGAGITTLLHTIQIKHKDKTVDNMIVMGSPTYINLNVSDYIATGFNSFAYTLDCSGYLNAAIEGSATVPGADITAKAGTSMDKQNSMFIGGGILISPLYAAYYGDAVGVNLNKEDRIAILNSIINTPGISLADIIELKMSYQVIWASSQGGQSFNGKAEFSAKGGIGIGVAQVSGSSNASGTISRSSSFSSFDTYLTNGQELHKPAEVTLAMLNDLIKTLK